MKLGNERQFLMMLLIGSAAVIWPSTIYITSYNCPPQLSSLYESPPYPHSILMLPRHHILHSTIVLKYFWKMLPSVILPLMLTAQSCQWRKERIGREKVKRWKRSRERHIVQRAAFKGLWLQIMKPSVVNGGQTVYDRQHIWYGTRAPPAHHGHAE